MGSGPVYDFGVCFANQSQKSKKKLQSAQFNAAVPGAKAINLTSQAIDLVRRMRKSDKALFSGKTIQKHYSETIEEHASIEKHY